MYDDVCMEEYINIYPVVSQGTHSSFTAHTLHLQHTILVPFFIIVYMVVCFVCFCL